VKPHLPFVLAAALCCGPTSANEVTNYLIGTRGGNRLPYRLSLPDDYAANTMDYPPLIYLHGISARGSDLKIGAGPGGKHWAERFIMIAPQFPADQTWWQAPPMDNIKKIVEHENTQLRVDDDRVYVIGYSMGGLEPITWFIHIPDYVRLPHPFSGPGPGSRRQSLSTSHSGVFTEPGTTECSCRATRKRLTSCGQRAPM